MANNKLPPALPSHEELKCWFSTAISEAGVSNGLAIIIGCRDSYQHPEQPLNGVKKDLIALHMTFRRLMLAILCLDNPTSSLIKEVMTYVSTNLFPIPDTWKRIVVTFSGHGKSNCLCATDGPVDFQEDIVDPLLPVRAVPLAHLSKLFFIDACRGAGYDPGVQINWRSHGGIVARGGSRRVSSKGGYVIACSTLMGMQSFEVEGIGGFWMQLLASQLVDEGNIERSIADILTRVNKRLQELSEECGWPIQQPVMQSALNQDVKLLQEALDLLPHQSQQRQQELVDLNQVQLEYILEQNKEFDKLILEWQQQQQPQQQQKQQQHLPQPDQQQYHLPLAQGAMGYDIPVPQEPSIYSMNPDECEFIHALAQHYSDGNICKPPEYQAAAVPNLYEVRVNMTGQFRGIAIVGRGSSKDDAAKDAVTQIKAATSSPRQPNERSASGGSDLKKKTRKSWKSKLEEYFKAQGMDVQIEYKTKEDYEGFKATVFCPKVGMASGEAQPTREKAEQNAAKKALKELQSKS